MTNTFKNLAWICPLAAMLYVGAGPEALAAQTPTEPQGTIPDKPQYQVGQYVGPASCASGNCHGSSEPRGRYDVLQNEFTTWLYEDPHNRAHEVLFSDRSAIIARNMGQRERAFEAPLCLDCHALSVPSSLRAERFDIEDGVSCESCHGPAGGWLDQHTDAAWGHDRSVANGMVDLRRADVRARACFSCHLGTAERQVNHDLIASGHPELVFELDNYSEAMPAHWKPFSSKRDREGRVDTHGARAWAAGQALAFREGLLQLARRARADAWPEFAEMSCESCHHSLRDSGWRQVRGYKYRPGVPPWSPARWGVLRHLVDRFAPQERARLETDVEELARSVADLRADPANVAATAERAASAMAKVIPPIERAGWSERQVRELMKTIAADGDYLLTTDRQTAEQAAMAVQSLFSYLSAGAPSSTKEDLKRIVDELFDELDDPYSFNPAGFVAVLERLAK